jgi:hypothetical protein
MDHFIFNSILIGIKSILSKSIFCIEEQIIHHMYFWCVLDLFNYLCWAQNINKKCLNTCSIDYIIIALASE